MFENNGHIHAFIPRAGVDNLLRSFVFKNLEIFCQCGHLLQDFPIKWLSNSFAHSNHRQPDSALP